LVISGIKIIYSQKLRIRRQRKKPKFKEYKIEHASKVTRYSLTPYRKKSRKLKGANDV